MARKFNTALLQSLRELRSNFMFGRLSAEQYAIKVRKNLKSTFPKASYTELTEGVKNLLQ